MLADVVVHQNSSQDSNNKCNSASDHHSNPHSDIYCNPCVMYTQTTNKEIHRSQYQLLYGSFPATTDEQVRVYFDDQCENCVASFPGLLRLQFWITCSAGSDQKLEPGKAWE